MEDVRYILATFLYKGTVVIVAGDGSMYQWFTNPLGEWSWRRLPMQIPE